jgi:hypothetical protein
MQRTWFNSCAWHGGAPQARQRRFCILLPTIGPGCRCRFFPASAAEDVLREYLPLTCPHDEMLYFGIGALSLLLPSDPL